jgi:hypothetical protein
VIFIVFTRSRSYPSNRPLSPSSTFAVSNFDARNQQKIHDFEVIVRLSHEDRTATRIRHELRMTDGDGASIRQMQDERLKRPRRVKTAQLVNGHGRIPS